MMQWYTIYVAYCDWLVAYLIQHSFFHLSKFVCIFSSVFTIFQDTSSTTSNAFNLKRLQPFRGTLKPPSTVHLPFPVLSLLVTPLPWTRTTINFIFQHKIKRQTQATTAATDLRRKEASTAMPDELKLQIRKSIFVHHAGSRSRRVPPSFTHSRIALTGFVQIRRSPRTIVVVPTRPLSLRVVICRSPLLPFPVSAHYPVAAVASQIRFQFYFRFPIVSLLTNQ